MHGRLWTATVTFLFFAPIPIAAQAPPINPANARLAQTLGGLLGPGFALAYDETTGLLVAAGERGTIPYCDKDVTLGVRTGDGPADVFPGHQGPVLALAKSGASVLASAGADTKVVLWSLPEGKALHALTAGSVVRALAVTPDGKSLASAGEEPAIQLWDIATGKQTAKLAGHTDWVLALAFSADGRRLASGGCDGVVRLWEVASGKKLLEFLYGRRLQGL